MEEIYSLKVYIPNNSEKLRVNQIYVKIVHIKARCKQNRIRLTDMEDKPNGYQGGRWGRDKLGV